MRRLLFTLLGTGVGAALGAVAGVAAGALLALVTGLGEENGGFAAIGLMMAGFWLGAIPGAAVGGAAGIGASRTGERVIGALAAVLGVAVAALAVVTG